MRVSAPLQLSREAPLEGALLPQDHHRIRRVGGARDGATHPVHRLAGAQQLGLELRQARRFDDAPERLEGRADGGAAAPSRTIAAAGSTSAPTAHRQAIAPITAPPSRRVPPAQRVQLTRPDAP
jgi:hypothetical protein